MEPPGAEVQLGRLSWCPRPRVRRRFPLGPATRVVATCQFDPLRDEGIDYAQRLAQANVPTELVLYRNA